jgi:hypothetical protein
VRQLLRDDAAHVLAGERPKDDDAVDAVDELRPEALMNRLGHQLRRERGGDMCHEAGARVLPDRAAEIRRQDDDAVAEVNGVPLRIGEPAIVEDLQEQIPGIGMRLLELVEQHD